MFCILFHDNLSFFFFCHFDCKAVIYSNQGNTCKQYHHRGFFLNIPFHFSWSASFRRLLRKSNFCCKISNSCKKKIQLCHGKIKLNSMRWWCFCFVLYQRTELNLYSTVCIPSLKSVHSRHFTLLGHIILIPRQTCHCSYSLMRCA